MLRIWTKKERASERERASKNMRTNRYARSTAANLWCALMCIHNMRLHVGHLSYGNQPICENQMSMTKTTTTTTATTKMHCNTLKWTNLLTNERTIEWMSEQTKIHAYVLLLTWLHCKASRCIVGTRICVWSASSSTTAVEWEKRKISIFNRYLTLYTSVLCKQTVLYLESNRFCLNNKYFKRHRYVILVWLIVCYGQPERSTSFFSFFS